MANKQNGEAGYLLIAVLFVMALLLFALATTAPRVSYDLRRDREIAACIRGSEAKKFARLSGERQPGWFSRLVRPAQRARRASSAPFAPGHSASTIE